VAGTWAPVLGRISMDVTAVRIDSNIDIGEGDWVELDYNLPEASTQSGLSQYELLTTLGSRSKRSWL
jgi:alanine racemase